MKKQHKDMAKGFAISAGIALAVITADKAFGISDRLAAKIQRTPTTAKTA